jgi:hypothetical protein
MHVCTRVRRGLTGIRARGRGAHKTRQATAKHLALLASLGMLGLSEHMVQVDLEWQGRHTRYRRAQAIESGERAS